MAAPNPLEALLTSPFAPPITPLKGTIKKCSVRELVNVETGRLTFSGIQAAANDPFVNFELNDPTWSGRTKQIDNAGDSGEWEDLQISFKCDETTLATTAAGSKLTVTCLDHNSITAHVFIGSAEVDISNLADNMNIDVGYEVELKQKNGEKGGMLKLTIQLQIDEETLTSVIKKEEVEAKRKAEEAAKAEAEEEARLKAEKERKKKEVEAAAKKKAADLALKKQKEAEAKTKAEEEEKSERDVSNFKAIALYKKGIKKRKGKSENILDRMADCELEGQKELDIAQLSLVDYPNDCKIFPNITRLVAFGNKFTDLPNLGDWYRRLEYMDLSRNGLTNLDAIDFTLLPSLRHLDISRNIMKTLSPGIVNLIRLEKLEVHRNQLEELPADISQLKSLVSLNLEYNNLLSISEELSDMPNLHDLNLRNNPRLDLNNLPQRVEDLHIKRGLLYNKQGRRALVQRALGFRSSAALKASML